MTVTRLAPSAKDSRRDTHWDGSPPWCGLPNGDRSAFVQNLDCGKTICLTPATGESIKANHVRAPMVVGIVDAFLHPKLHFDAMVLSQRESAHCLPHRNMDSIRQAVTLPPEKFRIGGDVHLFQAYMLIGWQCMIPHFHEKTHDRRITLSDGLFLRRSGLVPPFSVTPFGASPRRD